MSDMQLAFVRALSSGCKRKKKQIYSLLPESTKQNIQTAQSTKSLKRQTGCFYHEKAAAGLQQTDCRYTYYYGWQHCQRTTYLFLICLQTKTIIVFVCKTWSNQVIQNLFQVMCYALACCYDKSEDQFYLCQERLKTITKWREPLCSVKWVH